MVLWTRLIWFLFECAASNFPKNLYVRLFDAPVVSRLVYLMSVGFFLFLKGRQAFLSYSYWSTCYDVVRPDNSPKIVIAYKNKKDK